MRWPMPDSPDPADLRVVSSYFDRAPYVETDEAGATVYVEHHRTIGDRVTVTSQNGTKLTTSAKNAAVLRRAGWK